MPFVKNQRIQPEILRDKIYRVVCDEIVAGRLRPGEPLVESTVAKYLGVSRIPVREAFYLLEQQGFIRMIPHKGAFVTRLTRKELEDLLEMRELLETWVLHGARERLQPRHIQKLEELIVEMEKAAAARDYVTFYAKDMEFHTQIWRSRGNKTVEDTLHSTCASFVAFIMMIYAGRSHDLGAPLSSHRRFLELLKSGSDPQELTEWVKTHIKTGREVALEYIEGHSKLAGEEVDATVPGKVESSPESPVDFHLPR